MSNSKKKKFSKNNQLLVLKRILKVSKALPVLYLLFGCFHDTNPCRIKNKKIFFVFCFSFQIKSKSLFLKSFMEKELHTTNKTDFKKRPVANFFFSIFVSFINIYFQNYKILYLVCESFIHSHFLSY